MSNIIETKIFNSLTNFLQILQEQFSEIPFFIFSLKKFSEFAFRQSSVIVS